MLEQSSLDGSWMQDITPKTETLKILDGQTIILIHKDNGIKRPSDDYGESIAFKVQVVGEQVDKTFYVKTNNYDLLGQIKEIAKSNNGTLMNLSTSINREGSKRSDTRYKIIKI